MFFSFVLAQLQVPCSTPRIRQDFRVVQQQGKWQRIVNAIQLMKYRGRITYYAKLHSDLFTQIHNNIKFGMWHRALLWEFENEIRAIGGNDLTLPYIDWAGEGTTYNGQVDRSVANNPYYYAQQNGQCLTGQIYDSFLLSPIFKAGQCISRNLDTSVLVAGWADLDNTIINNNAYSGVSDGIQYGIHADVHVRFGGHMGRTFSPVDPLFMAHHAFIDMSLQTWQYVHSNFNNMGDPVSSVNFQINGNNYNHGKLFSLSNTCVQYQRYTNSKTTQKLSKRQSLVPTPGSTQPSTATLALATESALPAPSIPSAPQIPNVTADDLASYNAQISTFYDSLKQSINSPIDCTKKIADFYKGGFIPLDNHPSAKALQDIGLDPAKYQQISAVRDNQRNTLAQYANFVRKSVAESQNESPNKNGYTSGSSQMQNLAVLLLALVLS